MLFFKLKAERVLHNEVQDTDHTLYHLEDYVHKQSPAILSQKCITTALHPILISCNCISNMHDVAGLLNNNQTITANTNIQPHNNMMTEYDNPALENPNDNNNTLDNETNGITAIITGDTVIKTLNSLGPHRHLKNKKNRKTFNSPK